MTVLQPGEEAAGVRLRAAALEFSTAIAAVEAAYAAEVARTPERQPYLYAQRELVKDSLLVELMNKLHAYLHRRIAEQMKSVH